MWKIYRIHFSMSGSTENHNTPSWRSFSGLPGEAHLRCAMRLAVERIKEAGGPAVSTISGDALPTNDRKALANFIGEGENYRSLRHDTIVLLVGHLDRLWVEYFPHIEVLTAASASRC